MSFNRNKRGLVKSQNTHPSDNQEPTMEHTNTNPQDNTSTKEDAAPIDRKVEATVTEKPTPSPTASQPSEPAPKVVKEVPIPKGVIDPHVTMATQALEGRVARFKELYAKGNPLDGIGRKQLVLAVEDMLSIILRSSDYNMFRSMMDMFRNEIFMDSTGAFNTTRMLSNMVEPRSGRRQVKHATTAPVMTLITMTADPKRYKGMKGRIDLSGYVEGMSEETGAMLAEYYN